MFSERYRGLHKKATCGLFVGSCFDEVLIKLMSLLLLNVEFIIFEKNKKGCLQIQPYIPLATVISQSTISCLN